MTSTTEQNTFFSESKEQLEGYVKQRLQLFKMQLVEKMSQLIALLFTSLILALLGFFILLFFSIMAGYFFANIFESLYIGFAIVASFYVIITAILFRIKNTVIEPLIANVIVKKFFDKSFENNEDAAT
ncbi:MAG: phage holin family protein [Chitinophagaceae bacterium]